MRIGKYFLAAFFVLCFATAIYAAPVGLTSEADATKGELWSDNNIALNAGVIVDSVTERRVDIDSGEFEMDAYLARIGLSFMDRLNVYIDLGMASGMEYTYVLKGETYQDKFEDELMWGIGGSAMLYRWDNGFEVGVNASYRTAEMNFDETTIGGNYNVKRETMSSVIDGDFSEWQGALELAWKHDIFTPYAGVKYSDVEVDSEYTLSGIVRSAKGRNASQNVGVFVGLALTPKMDSDLLAERLMINVEGRFVDEEAINVSASYKF